MRVNGPSRADATARHGRRLAQLAAEAADALTPTEALQKMRELRSELEAFERQQVARAIADGATFAAVARDLGLSRQAVHRRFRDLVADDAPTLTTAELRRVLRCARDEATALGADVPRGEHVVLGTLAAGDLPEAGLLRAAGATLDRARTQVAAMSAQPPRFRRDGPAEELRSPLEALARDSRRRRGRRIDVPDLLLAVLAEENGAAGRVLRALGVNVAVIRDELQALLDVRAGS